MGHGARLAGTAIPRELLDVFASLLSNVDSIVDEITRRLLEDEYAYYQAVPDSLREFLQTCTRKHVAHGLQMLAGHAAPGKDTAHLFRKTGRHLARRGVPMEQVFKANTQACRVLWEAVMETAQDPARAIAADAMMQACHRVWTEMDGQHVVVVEAYRRETVRLRRCDRQRRVLEALVEGRGSDERVVAEVRDALGVSPDIPLGCAAAPLDGSVRGPLAGLLDEVEQAGGVAFVHEIRDMQVALVPFRNELDLNGLIAILGGLGQGRIGVALASDVAAFASAFALAAGAAETLPRNATGVASASDHLPALLVRASPEIADFLIRETLGPVLAKSSSQCAILLQTLTVLLEQGGSSTRAATMLQCHRNTAFYRKRQIERLTGRNLSDSADRLQFTLALIALAQSQPQATVPTSGG